MASKDPFERPLTAQEAVTREIRRAIVARELKPGQRIHQEQLASELGVSRVPIREALRGLEAEGQVVSKPNRGYYVIELSLIELQEIYRLRRLIEDEMNHQAAANMDEDTVSRLENLISEMSEAEDDFDVRRFVSLNREFHFTIFERAGLPQFKRVAEILWQNSESYRSMYLNDPEVLRRIRDEHESILSACRRRHADGLVKQSSRHRDQAVARLQDLLDAASH